MKIARRPKKIGPVSDDESTALSRLRTTPVEHRREVYNELKSGGTFCSKASKLIAEQLIHQRPQNPR